MVKYVVCLCRRCDECCVFCLNCEACSGRCSCMGSVIVSLFIHCKFVLNVAFCMTCSLLLMLVEDARGNHMEEAYSRAVLTTTL